MNKWKMTHKGKKGWIVEQKEQSESGPFHTSYRTPEGDSVAVTVGNDGAGAGGGGSHHVVDVVPPPKWLDIKDAPRDGSYIVISLKERHWYDGPQVVSWNNSDADDLKGSWLAEGWTYCDADIRGWAPIPQADY